MGGDQRLWWGTKGEEMILHSEKPTHGRELGWGIRRPSVEHRETSSMSWRQNQARTAQLICAAPHAPAGAVQTGARCWREGFGEWMQGEHFWLQRESQKGRKLGNSKPVNFSEDVQSTVDARCHHWGAHKGLGHHCHPLPHLPVPASTHSGGTPTRVRMSQYTATSCLCLLHRVPTHTPEWLLYLSPARVSALISQSAAFSFHLHPLSLGQGTDAWVCPTCIYGAKTKAEHQGLWD